MWVRGLGRMRTLFEEGDGGSLTALSKLRNDALVSAHCCFVQIEDEVISFSWNTAIQYGPRPLLPSYIRK